MPAEPVTSSHRSAGQLIFAMTVLLSAFLLFQVQPLLGKFILPWFGGSPAVWTTAMLFFQVVLFGGYTYAHGIVRFLSPRGQVLTHVVVIALACCLLPIIPAESWKERMNEAPTGVIFLLLATTIGLPYFVLSATGPLLQTWYHQWKADGSPYRLYALSNAGSLAGLLTYPLMVEPNLRLNHQAWTWSGGFGLFALFCLGSGSLVWNSRSRLAEAPETSTADSVPVSWRSRLEWLGLSMLGSILLLATTNHVCQDVAVIPFLWVVPLCLYLLTFIISFDKPEWYARKWVAVITVLWLITVQAAPVLEDLTGRKLGIVSIAILSFGALFWGCLVCHGELVRRAPAAGRLTEFYLFMSAGGALGGLFVSLLAPVLFDSYLEWPLGLAAVIVLGLSIVLGEFKPAQSENRSQWLGKASIICLVGGMLLIQIGKNDLSSQKTLYAERNFYGIVTVREQAGPTADKSLRTIVNGGIAHGRQFQAPSKNKLPLAYYGPNTGVGQALELLKDRPNLKTGMVGLGVGTLATYIQPGQSCRFYEINPTVETAARDYFTYLADCQGTCDVVIGDARLVLQQEEPQNYDLLVLDAFSGDAVPTHLLTTQAFELYLKHLKPDGLLVVHITNTYLDLVPVLRGLSSAHQLPGVIVETTPDRANELEHTTYAVLTRQPDLLSGIKGQPLDTSSSTLPTLRWTDDFSDLLSILRRREPSVTSAPLVK